MFGLTLPPGIEQVRVLALSGRKGKPPCLWEGPPTEDQGAIEAAMGRDPRIVRWLRRNGLVRHGVATLSLQVDCFSQGQRVESFTVAEVPILVSGLRRKPQAVGDVAIVRALDLCEHMLDSYKEFIEERDTVIGRLVERGLKAGEEKKQSEPPAQSPAPEKDSFDDLLEKGQKLIALASSFKALRSEIE